MYTHREAFYEVLVGLNPATNPLGCLEDDDPTPVNAIFHKLPGAVQTR